MPAPTLEELAPAGSDVTADPYPALAALRERGRVHRIHVPGTGDVWLVLGRDEVRAALTDHRLRNDIRHSATWDSDGGHAIGLNMLQTDAPHHTRLRALVAREFTAGRVDALRPRVQQIADELLDALPPAGTFDLVAGYALPLPLTVICELLGVPSADQHLFHAWSAELVAPSSPAAAATAGAEMTAYFASLISAKAGDPGTDLMSALVLASADEEGLSPEELLGMAFLLLVAGHETTVNLISGGVLNLLRHPDQLAALRADPSLLGGAIEEMLRHDGPVTSAAFRHAAEPLEIAGVRIPAGDSVMLSLASASRDPEHFPDPDRFDIRRPARGHLAFGHGIHHCLGAPLARLEGRIALATLLRRLPDLALALDAGPDALPRRANAMLRGVAALPVSWSRTLAASHSPRAEA
ncbi:cytochrome P450 [Streptomyces sp. NBC_01565]|uniref:cytochrome P450 family protein n=1 Tax=Streptomyces sp. NBC_01565 TaxID=2975881 RepID=UPI002258FE29|nr:cytochrome P450 [Streptomyces sp. NBC_01565]MCX4546149.1 cytochrome P450 [Streptomyces sp. NBC_01565]